MRTLFCLTCCVALARTSSSQSFRPDWHSGDYPGRDLAMWSVIADDLKTSFPRGGAPVTVKSFLQDDRRILALPDADSNQPIGLSRAKERSGVILRTRGGQQYFNGDSLVASADKITEVE